MISYMIDFTQCERLPNRAYNGANGKKRRIFYKVYRPACNGALL